MMTAAILAMTAMAANAQNPFVQTNCLAAWPLVSPTRKTTGDDLQTKDYKAFTAKANGATSLHDLYLCTDEAEGDISLNWWKFK